MLVLSPCSAVGYRRGTIGSSRGRHVPPHLSRSMLCTVRIRPIPLLLALVVGHRRGAPGPRRGRPRPRRVRAAADGPRRRSHHPSRDGRRHRPRVPARRCPRATTTRSRRRCLFDFHGLGSDMQEQAVYTQLAEQGGARGYVVITPNGQGDVLRRWSLVASANANPDVAFVQAMLRATNRNALHRPAGACSRPASRTAPCSRPCSRARCPGRFAAIAPVAGINATKVCDAGTPPRERARVPRHRRSDRALPGRRLLRGRRRRPHPRRAAGACRSTTPRRRGLRSTGAGRPRRPPGSPTTCSTWSGPTARPTAPSRSTASSAVVTPGPVRFRSGRPGSGRRPRRSTPPRSSSTSSTRTDASADRGCVTWRRRTTSSDATSGSRGSQLGEGGGEELLPARASCTVELPLAGLGARRRGRRA